MFTQSKIRKSLLRKVVSFVMVICLAFGFMLPLMPATASAAAPNSYTNITADSTAYVSITSSGTSKYFRFVPTQSGTYRFYSSNNSGDPKASLLDANGSVITTSDDYNGNNFSITHECTANTTYYLQAYMFSSNTGSYTLNVQTVSVTPTPTPNVPAGTLDVNATGAYSLFNSGATSSSGYKSNSASDGVDTNPDSSSYSNNGYDIYGRAPSKPGTVTIGMGLSFTISQPVTERAVLTVYAYDIDEEDGQIDTISLVDETTGYRTTVGTLAGMDGQWNTTTLYIDASSFTVGNTYHFEDTISNGTWWSYIRTVSIQLTTGGEPPIPIEPIIVDHSFNASISTTGTVTANLYLQTSQSIVYTLEYAASINGNQKGSLLNQSITATTSGAEKQVSFSLESGAPAGTYQIDVIIKDAQGNPVTTYRATAGYSYSAVSYDSNGGSNQLPNDNTAYTSGDTVTVLFDYIPSRTGYNFLGWATTSTATTPEYTENGTNTFTIGSTDVTLYAVWKEAPVVVDPPITSADTWDGTVDTSWYNSSATEYTIYTAEELAGLAQLVNNGTTFSGKTVNLGNNIDLNNLEWTPIGVGGTDGDDYTTKAYMGVFNGNGYNVNNLYVNLTSTKNAGLFGVLNGSRVYILSVTNANVAVTQAHVVSGGVIVGKMRNTTIEQCYVEGSVNVIDTSTGSNHCVSAGLILGRADSNAVINNCYALGAVEGDMPYDWNSYVGGIVGCSDSGDSLTVSNSYFVGTVTAGAYETAYAGGILGRCFNSSTVIRNCFMSGTLNSEDYCGGILTNNSTPSVSNSYYSAVKNGTNENSYGTSTSASNFASQAWIESNLGWDFTDVWEMKANADYPTLRGFGNGGNIVPCEHEYEHIETSETCTTSGESKDVCIHCGNVTNYVYIPASGHNVVSEVTKEATCDEDGIITYTCVNDGCGYCYEINVHVEHNYEMSVVEPTCTEDGATVYTCTLCGDVNAIPIPASHNFVAEVTTPATRDQDGEITYTCTVCGYWYTEVIPASNANVLVIQDRIPWDVNNIPALLNDMMADGYIDGWSMTTTSTIASVDLSLYDVILIANDQTTATYNQLRVLDSMITEFVTTGGTVIYGACDHGWSAGDISFDILGEVEKTDFYSMRNYIVDADHPIVTGALTDDKAITNDLLLGTYCSHSGFKADTLPAGYNIILQDGQGNATLAEYSLGAGRVILSGLTWEFYYSRIYSGQTSYSMNVFDDLIAYAVNFDGGCEHKYDSGTDVEATCTTEGYTLHICSECGSQYKDNFVSALGHDMGDWIVDSQPDCINPGEQYQTCNRCGETIIDIIPAQGSHTPGEWFVDVEPTCAEGRQCKKCTVCDTIIAIESIAPIAYHTLGDWIVDVAPTATSTGSRHKECTACGATVETEVMPILAKFVIADVGASEGSTVRVTIDVQNNPGICGAILTISYDSALTLVGAEAGGAWNSLMFTNPGEFTNPCNFVWAGGQNADYGNGTIIVLTFAIPDGAALDTVYEISASYLAENMLNANLEPMDIAIENGSITVINLEGDVNGDGVVDVLDVITLSRYMAGGYNVTIDELAADMNNDGVLTVADIVLLRRYIVG